MMTPTPLPVAELSVRFFLDLALILLAARLCGYAGRRWLGQPPVVGEMIAGVLLGPSLLGLAAPALTGFLFPVEIKRLLYVLAQLGVGLYMFIVGLGFDAREFRAHRGSALAVSLSGMAAPFGLALLLAPWLLSLPGLFAPNFTLAQAVLFTGACISITAFPMLARIIQERGLAGSPLGALALAAGAMDDAAAWAVLAIVLASFGDGPLVAVKAIGGGLAFAVLMLGPGRRLVGGIARLSTDAGLATALILFLLAAFLMDWVGMHAVFGGFLLGTAMPRGAFAGQLRARLLPLTVVLLLPIFFTYSGLNTQLALVADPALALVTLTILAASIAAKFGACWLAARLTGQDQPTALGIGALMNARGLMELIIINIGLQRGLIGPPLFAMLVVMAIVTTLMAAPLFELVQRRPAPAVS
ncbi:cation:proton antiporter [Sphingomonas sp.]|uniref:cation:proton antiporter n=1 Tax=Sphingomonas sp. TaxID=28214 RepID=UPI0034141147